MPSRLHNFHTLSSGQLHTSTSAEGELVHMEAPPILIRRIGTQSHRWRGAQHHIAIGPDPIPMPMAVEHEDTRGVGRERVQDVWGIDQCETDALVQFDRIPRMLDDVMME